MLQVRKVSHVQCRNTVELHLFPSPVILLCKSPINWPTPHGVCLKNELNHREYVNWNDTSRCQLPCESILNQVYNPRNERCKKLFLVILIHVTKKSAFLWVHSGFYPHVRHPSSNESFPWKWFCGSVVLWKWETINIKILISSDQPARRSHYWLDKSRDVFMRYFLRGEVMLFLENS